MKWMKDALVTYGDKLPIQTYKRVLGGSINECYYVRTENKEYFLKHHPNSPENFFLTEKIGLNYLRETNTVNIPTVYGYSDQPTEAYLLMEWVEGEKDERTEEILGTQLANLHKTPARQFGFKNDTYIGKLKQSNDLYDDWLSYYRDEKLASQIKYGVDQRQISKSRYKKLSALLNRLDQWLPGDVEPSYLHGDLWGGNWIVGDYGEPYLIDPSFFFGDRLMDIAFTELFGGFSQQFYNAYENIKPLDDVYEDVKPLYQLYYLVIHINMFGGMYGPQIDAVLNRYVP